ncbi:MAG: pyridoxal phosphate-dependent decarboxylase family protein, partial [Dermatophilaceae bacterium]
MTHGPALPERGTPWRVLEQQLTSYQVDELPYERGLFERYWPAYPAESYLAARSAQAMFAHTNVFSVNALPSLARIDRELRAMVAEVLLVPPGGAVTLTGGGTESNFLAIKAARELGRQRGVRDPNIVIPMTAHPSLDKAADELGLRVRRTAVDDDFRASPSATRDALDDDTVLIAASAPSYPQGVVDPVEEIAAVAAERDIWMHVDACVGGFLLAFLRDVDPATPRFGLELDGVWSISADLHKFGLCLNGISTLCLRDDLRQLHTFTLPEPGWHYRPYERIGFAGSRPGGTLAAAWATLRTLGR